VFIAVTFRRNMWSTAAVVAMVAGATLLGSGRASAAAYGPEVTAVIPVGAWPQMTMAIDPSIHQMYVLNDYPATVTVVAASGNTGRVTAVIPVAPYPYSVAVDPSNHRVYVSDHDGVQVIDESGDAHNGEIIGAIPVFGLVSIDTSDHTVWIANTQDATVQAIDESGDAHNGQVTSTISIPGADLHNFEADFEGLAVDSSNHNVYVTNFSVGTWVIEPATGTVTLIPDVAPFYGPSEVAVDAGNHNVYVLGYYGGIEVINEGGGPDNGHVSWIFAGQDPDGVAVDPTTHDLYVTISTDEKNTLSVVDESGDAGNGTVTAVVPFGPLPVGIDAGAQVAVDPTTDHAYVLYYGAGTISVISPQVAPADIAATVTAPSRAAGGSQFAEHFTVTDNGPATAAGVVTNVLVPKGLTVDAAPGSSPGRGALIWWDHSLAPGQSTTYTITFTVAAGVHGAVSLGGFAVSFALEDPDLANNTAVTRIQLG
jgi:DNA-binding beta-propeller fold protein YncE